MIEEILYTSLKAKIARKTIYAKAKERSLEINEGQYRLGKPVRGDRPDDGFKEDLKTGRE
jgi:hypothetical protein